MAPTWGESKTLEAVRVVRRNVTVHPGPPAAYDEAVWQGGFNVASVDLIAMLVSDAGLSAIEPQWWNASPVGCILIGLQPRGGWQIMQRAVQWGNDFPANCFGVSCSPNVLYQYFACSIRNRLEVWKSDRFETPTRIRYTVPAQPPGPDIAIVEGKTPYPPTKIEHKVIPSGQQGISAGTGQGPASTTPSPRSDTGRTYLWVWAKRRKREEQFEYSKAWQAFDVDDRRPFNVPRPTKLVDGSRGGQAFMCELLRPKNNQAYSIEEQARMQLLSIIMVAASLIKDEEAEEWQEILKEDFQLDENLGRVFRRLLVGLALISPFVACFIVSVCYALWVRNIYGRAVPYAIQLCSLASWAFGATGLLMLGGNPRVKTSFRKGMPDHIKARLLENIQVHGHNSLRIRDLDQAGNLELRFGSQHGSLFTPDGGSCVLPGHIVQRICSLRLELVRTTGWYLSFAWFTSYLGASIVLQIAGAKVATVSSEVMSVIILVLTSVFRGQGISASEARMIPSWRAWPGARYGAQLLGRMESRAGTTGV